jgi:hypothetical protein
VLHRHDLSERLIEPLCARGVGGERSAANEFLNKGGLLFITHLEEGDFFIGIKEIGINPGLVF